MSVGDGGLSEELDSTGQNIDDLRGKILRIDVSGDLPYTIPADNPFVATQGYRPEIWLLGFRNPWKFSFVPGSPRDVYCRCGLVNYRRNQLPARRRFGRRKFWLEDI